MKAITVIKILLMVLSLIVALCIPVSGVLNTCDSPTELLAIFSFIAVAVVFLQRIFISEIFEYKTETLTTLNKVFGMLILLFLLWWAMALHILLNGDKEKVKCFEDSNVVYYCLTITVVVIFYIYSVYELSQIIKKQTMYELSNKRATDGLLDLSRDNANSANSEEEYEETKNYEILKSTTKKVEKLIEDENCIFCTKHFQIGELKTEMYCSHSFHRNCLIGWIYRCPLCPMCHSPFQMLEITLKSKK
jgi:hypothetical protein